MCKFVEDVALMRGVRRSKRIAWGFLVVTLILGAWEWAIR
jgi:hypothetical protein